MSDYDFSHLNKPGIYPVRALRDNILHSLEKLSPELFGLMVDEIKYNGLKNGISYNISTKPISDIAHITGDRKIEMFENYNAFLWCMSYALIVLFDESIQRPTLDGTYTGIVDRSNPLVKKALALFEYGMSLRIKYSSWPSTLPNPEKYSEEDKFYVEKANGVFVCAITVVLCHEVAHQFLGHLDYSPATKDEYLKDEQNADNFALDFVNKNFEAPIYQTLRAGAVVAFSSLLFLNKSLDGGDYHPDQDFRLENIMNRLNLNDIDNLWGIASLSFKLWSVYYNKPYPLSSAFENYRDLFAHTLDSIRTNIPAKF